MRLRRLRLILLPLATVGLVACTFEPNSEGVVVSETRDGLIYEATFATAAWIDTSGGTAEISPFPVFYDGVLVTRRDGVTLGDADRAAAGIVAAKYCARAGQVPDSPEGWFLPNNAGWYFGKCGDEPQSPNEIQT